MATVLCQDAVLRHIEADSGKPGKLKLEKLEKLEKLDGKAALPTLDEVWTFGPVLVTG
jgi:hypothetical protein